MELPYKEKFDELPEVELEELVDYFNLEFAAEGNDKFVVDDFTYIGVHVLNGVETMCWSVENCKVCALVKPFDDSYILEMGDGPKGGL